MTQHPDATELEDFVQGQLADAPRRRLEAHVDGCHACAAALAREARLELTLIELGTVAAAPAVAPRLPRSYASSRRSLYAVAAAATVAVLILALRDGSVPPGTIAHANLNVTCAAGAEQAACIRDAHRHGLFVQYPSWAGPPPLGAIAPDDGLREAGDPDHHLAEGPSRPPFPVTDHAAP